MSAVTSFPACTPRPHQHERSASAQTSQAPPPSLDDGGRVREPHLRGVPSPGCHLERTGIRAELKGSRTTRGIMRNSAARASSNGSTINPAAIRTTATTMHKATVRHGGFLLVNAGYVF